MLLAQCAGGHQAAVGSPHKGLVEELLNKSQISRDLKCHDTHVISP